MEDKERKKKLIKNIIWCSIGAIGVVLMTIGQIKNCSNNKVEESTNIQQISNRKCMHFDDRGNYVSDNLLNIEDKSSTTTNGVTYSISNGAITLDGTPTNDYWLTINFNKTDFENYSGTLTLKSFASNTFNNYELRFIPFNDGLTNRVYSFYTNRVSNNSTFTFTNSSGWFCQLHLITNQTYNNFTIKPMLVEETTIPTTFEPYGVYYSQPNYDQYGAEQKALGESIGSNFNYSVIGGKYLVTYIDWQEHSYLNEYDSYSELANSCMNSPITINNTYLDSNSLNIQKLFRDNLKQYDWLTHKTNQYYNCFLFLGDLHIKGSEYNFMFERSDTAYDVLLDIKYTDGTIEHYSSSSSFSQNLPILIKESNKDKEIAYIGWSGYTEDYCGRKITQTLELSLYQSGYSDGKYDGTKIGYENGFKSGNDKGYKDGYIVGLNENLDNYSVSPFQWAKDLTGAITNILSVRVIPGVTLATLVTVPIIFWIALTIIKTIKKG